MECYGSKPEDCCNYIDDGNCTLNCSEGRKANATFHCVKDDGMTTYITIFQLYKLEILCIHVH